MSKNNVNKSSKNHSQETTHDAAVDKEKKLKQLEQELLNLQNKLSQRESSLNARERDLKQKEVEATNGFPELLKKEFAKKEKQLDERLALLDKEFDKVEKAKSEIRVAKLALDKAEIERKNGYAQERQKIDEELHQIKTQKLDELEKSLAEKREERLKELDAETDSIRNGLDIRKQDLDNREFGLQNLKTKLEGKSKELDYRADFLDDRYTRISEEVDQQVRQRKASFDKQTEQFEEEIARLQESIQQSTSLLNNFEHLKRKLGDKDPAEVIQTLIDQEDSINKLRIELTERPTHDQIEVVSILEEKNNTLQREKDRFEQSFKKLHKSQSDAQELHLTNQTQAQKISSLEDQIENVKAHSKELQEQIKRYRAPFVSSDDYVERIEEIEKPLIKDDVRFTTEDITESEWLDRIHYSCDDYGIKFPRRILDAFHTALKTSEWSPLTVLAGVSGTGKSELPRLYSRFGGINFLSLSVQPNWDSQESMLGFFNSIDNKFDAQPVLRFLAQSQKEQSEEYPYGLHDAMNIVLMDEMNLAHIELYFAEFLSKLELRRGMKGELPKLDVKLGSNVPPYKLDIGRNVLWTGTMNQDETTKSLSDKVLDRGIVIHFPRPKKLERRKKLKSLPERAPLLPRKIWQQWWNKESTFTDEQIMPYKEFIEEMNAHLSKVGRALGHRVWQSVEYYMMNHPNVMDAAKSSDGDRLGKAMKIAFEDQLVQKVMPKLRGIETRGSAKTECLDKIRAQLVQDDYAIVEDFELAQEFGYGQFIWNSANYLANSTAEEEELIGEEFAEMEALIKYSADQEKKPVQLSLKEIIEVLNCTPAEAKEWKEQFNKLPDA